MADSPSTESLTIRNYHGIEYDLNDPKFAGLSKNAVKRILKEELWEKTREERAKQQKAKDKRKRADRQLLVDQGLLDPPPKRSRNQAVALGNRKVVFDCAFSSYMTQKEIDSTASQLMRCYSANRSAKEAMHMHITSLDKPLKDALNKKVQGWVNWKHVEAHEAPYEQTFDKSKLVYLSADSETVAHELEEDAIYIIGGIVDKNRHKGLCQNKAAEQDIKTAQLPIGEYIQMASRKVLTVNQVYEIMLKWVECRDWEKAFMEVIPGRKLKDSKLINKDQDGENDGAEKSDDEGDQVDANDEATYGEVTEAPKNDGVSKTEEASDTK